MGPGLRRPLRLAAITTPDSVPAGETHHTLTRYTATAVRSGSARLSSPTLRWCTDRVHRSADLQQSEKAPTLSWQARSWFTSRVHRSGSFLPSKLSNSNVTLLSSSSAKKNWAKSELSVLWKTETHGYESRVITSYAISLYPRLPSFGGNYGKYYPSRPPFNFKFPLSSYAEHYHLICDLLGGGGGGVKRPTFSADL